MIASSPPRVLPKAADDEGLPLQRRRGTSSPSSIDAFLASKPLLFDLETDSLRADFGLIFCAVIRPFQMSGRGKSERFVIDLRPRDMQASERAMLLRLRKRLEGAPGFISFYGHRFDMPFLQTRFLMAGIPPLPKVRHLDAYFTSKRVLNPGHVITSGRMAAVQALLKSGDRAAPMKSGVDAATWRKVKFGRDEKALAQIVKHCDVDLDVLEFQIRVWAKAGLLPLKVAVR